VGTPVELNKINKTSLNKVFEFLNTNTNSGDAIVLRSTVPIGLTRNYCESINANINYCFAPERTIEGKATFELATLPQIFGSNDIMSKVFFKEFFGLVSSEVFEVSKSESAELVKLTSNVYRDVTFGFSNEISLISYKNNISSKEVIDACNYKYPRCNIFSSGPVAGPCLSKDAYILSESIDQAHTISMILSSRKLNENYILDILRKLIKGVKSVSILGLSFKGTPPTNDIRDSYALSLIDFLRSKSMEVSSYDPLVFDEDFKLLKLKRDNTLEDAFIRKDLIIIQNNNEIFKRMNINKLSSLMNKNSVILDLWSLHKDVEINNSKYIGI
jgi:UDP-N-acetyl-D-mannosaminuronic acid dehydrogenase